MRIIGILFLFIIGVTKAQTGTLQVYCIPGVFIYVDEQLKGKTTEEMSGLLIEDVPEGEHVVKVFKNGYATQEKAVNITTSKITEVRFEMVEEVFKKEISGGILLHGGAFGLFNVNNVFTKADYTLGFTPYVDVKLHDHFALGFEVMSMWGQPQTNDLIREIHSGNVRVQFLFDPFEKVHFNLLVASGFTLWPGNTNQSYITPTYNDTRTGWDFRAAGGIEVPMSDMFSMGLDFGYWASSSTSDNIVWITHDSMIMSLGAKMRFSK